MAATSEASRVNDVGTQASSCGYCGSKSSTSLAHGMIAQNMNIEDYQDLIDLGWRRSGTYLYKPDQQKTCCPPYTVRMSANDFTPNKDQGRMLKKLARFLEGRGAALPGHVTLTAPQAANQGMAAGGADGSTSAPVDTGSGSPQQQQPHQGVHKQDPAVQPTVHQQQQQQVVQQQASGPIRLRDLQLRPALCHVLSSAAQVLQAMGVLPTQMVLPPLTVVPRAAGKAKPTLQQQATQQAGAGAPQAGSPEHQPVRHKRQSSGSEASSRSQQHTGVQLSSPCCLALAAAAQRAAGAATMQQDTGDLGQPTVPTPTAPELAVVMQAVVRDVLLALVGQGQEGQGAQGQGMDTSAGGSGQSTQRTNAIAAAASQVKEALHALATQQDGQAPGPAAPSPEASTGSCAALLRSLGCCQVEACGGYLNITCPPDAQAAGEAEAPPLSSRHHKQAKLVQGPPRSRGASPGGEARGQPSTSTGTDADDGGGAGGGGRGGSCKLEVVVLPSRFTEEEFQLYRRYQISQHGDDPEDVTREAYTRFLVDSPLTRLPPHKRTPPPPGAPPAPPVRVIVTSEQALEVARVATQAGGAPADTQGEPGAAVGGQQGAPGAVTCQGSDVGAEGSSGRLAAEGGRTERCIPPCGYGTFHMQYRIDGVLVAVGVVDILPRCLSGVYLFWDPAARNLGLGKLTALYELLWVQQAVKVCPDLKWYYMGFYIHTCHKMRYKAEYQPSDLLCPSNKVWVRVSPNVMSALDKERLVTISHLPSVTAFRNWAHNEQEAAAAAAAAGLHLLPGTDQLAPASSQPGRPAGQGSGSRGVASTTAGPSNTSGSGRVRDTGSVTPGDVMVVLWSKLAQWKVLRQEITAAGAKMINKRLEAWLQLVGSLGGRLVYCLE